MYFYHSTFTTRLLIGCLLYRFVNPLLADIKPENILLTAFDDSVANAKLGDLGMASALESIDGSFPAQFKGTPNYMAPEMRACERSAAGHEVSPRIDVFSLGMVCYEMASFGRKKGTWPEIGNQTNEELFAVLTEGRCKAVALAAMEREPLMRPTAKELLELTGHFNGTTTSRDSAVRGSFFAYIILQPSAVLTGCGSNRTSFVSRLNEIEARLRGDLRTWVSQHRFPLCLSDADSGTVRTDLMFGRIHSLVWSADGGIGWEPPASQETINLAMVEYALAQTAHVPRNGIVCMRFGARRTAERLHAAGIEQVFWIRGDLMDERGVELFSSVIVPVLGALDSALPEELRRTIEDIVSGENEWGLVAHKSCQRHFAWTPDLRSAKNWLEIKAPKPPPNNFQNAIDQVWRDELELLSCDLPFVKKASDLFHERHARTIAIVSPSDDADGVIRCRSVAFDVCKSFLVSSHALVEAVYRVASQRDIEDVTETLACASKNLRVLLWIDGSASFAAHAEDFWEAITNRLGHVYCLATFQDASICEQFIDFAENCHSLDIGEPTGIPGATVSSLHEELKLCLNDGHGNRFDLLRDVEMATLQTAVNEALKGVVAGIYIDDDDALFVRVCVTDVGALHTLRDEALTGELASGLTVALHEAIVSKQGLAACSCDLCVAAALVNDNGGERTVRKKFDGPTLVLVHRDSPNRCVFEHAREIAGKSEAALTLASHPGWAVVQQYETPKNAGERSYLEMGIGPAANAIMITFDGEFITRTSDERVLDVAHWECEEDDSLGMKRRKYEEGILLSTGQRLSAQFTVTPDGTIACTHAPHLALGVSKPRVVLVKPDSPLRLVFEHASKLCAGGVAMPLTLSSHAGLGVATARSEPFKAGPFNSKELVIGPGSDALKVTQNNKFIVDSSSKNVFDVHMWKFFEGNHLSLLQGRDITHNTEGGGRDFDINPDGTISPTGIVAIRFKEKLRILLSFRPLRIFLIAPFVLTIIAAHTSSPHECNTDDECGPNERQCIGGTTMPAAQQLENKTDDEQDALDTLVTELAGTCRPVQLLYMWRIVPALCVLAFLWAVLCRRELMLRRSIKSQSARAARSKLSFSDRCVIDLVVHQTTDDDQRDDLLARGASLEASKPNGRNLFRTIGAVAMWHYWIVYYVRQRSALI